MKVLMTFPRPEKERWQPLRSGLLNIYKFDEEEFHYKDGRLLLRGNNGTGKSRVLALQLPFLLDGDIASHRMEPDGDRAKRMEWNLLMGKYPNRLGYTWIEFGQKDPSGEEYFLTLGCGLNATEGKGLTGKWFFITSKRVGESLFLKTPTGQPLSRDRLEKAIQTEGQVYTTIPSYRAAIDEKLFKLGQRRYEALINLLIQLRQPQLSRQFEERKLSGALTEALAPLKSSVIDDVSESFRSLETDRNDLNSFISSLSSVEAFLREYSLYAQIAACRRAEDVRQRQAAYELVLRKLRETEAELNEAKECFETALNQEQQLTLEESAVAAEVSALESSPQMQSARDLDRVRQLARDRAQEMKNVQLQHENALKKQAEVYTKRAAAEEKRIQALQQLEEHIQSVRSSAQTLSLERSIEEMIASLHLQEAVSNKSHRILARKKLEAEIASKAKSIQHLEHLNQILTNAERELEKASQAETELGGLHHDALDAELKAQQTVKNEIETHVKAYRHWLGTLKELKPSELEPLQECVREWAETLEKDSPTSMAARQAERSAIERLSAGESDIKQQLSHLRQTIEELHQQLESLRAGRHEPPAAPYFREVLAREQRPGAPLWKLCDFSEGLDDEMRCGIESALEASGLLDAWVTPDGHLFPKDIADTVFIDTGLLKTKHLGQWLIPSKNADVSESVVARLLQQIGIEEGEGCQRRTHR